MITSNLVGSIPAGTTYHALPRVAGAAEQDEKLKEACKEWATVNFPQGVTADDALVLVGQGFKNKPLSNVVDYAPMKQRVVVRLDLSKLVHFQSDATESLQTPFTLLNQLIQVMEEALPGKDWTLEIKEIDISGTCLQASDLGKWEGVAKTQWAAKL